MHGTRWRLCMKRWCVDGDAVDDAGIQLRLWTAGNPGGLRSLPYAPLSMSCCRRRRAVGDGRSRIPRRRRAATASATSCSYSSRTPTPFVYVMRAQARRLASSAKAANRRQPPGFLSPAAHGARPSGSASRASTSSREARRSLHAAHRAAQRLRRSFRCCEGTRAPPYAVDDVDDNDEIAPKFGPNLTTLKRAGP